MRALHHCGKLLRKWQLLKSASLSTTSCIRSQNNADVKWLWELNETQREFYKANLSGTRIGTFVMTFNTVKPLSASDFRETIGHLQRKIPHLRTYMRFHGDRLCFCQPADFKPSFQVVEDVCNIRDVIYDMVRNFIEYPEAASCDTRVVFQNDGSFCRIPEVKETHPFQYTSLYTAHHALMDGMGCAFVMRCFMEILLNTVNGEATDSKQCASFNEEQEIPALISHFGQRLIEDADFSSAVRETLPPPDFIPLIFQAYPRPKPVVATTKFVTGVIEPKSFSFFKLRCKREGVTFNSFIVAVINIAVMELAREKGIIADSYTISPNVVTAYRRYKKQASEFFLGPCAGPLSFRSTVNANAISDFWHYCKTIDNVIHSYIKEGLPLHQAALSVLNDRDQSYDYTSNLRPILNDYVLTNLGDFTNIVSKHDVIKLTDVRSMNFIHNSYHNHFHEIMSFDNRLYYTLSYPTNCLSDETAQLFIDKIFSIFEYVSPN